MSPENSGDQPMGDEPSGEKPARRRWRRGRAASDVQTEEQHAEEWLAGYRPSDAEPSDDLVGPAQKGTGKVPDGPAGDDWPGNGRPMADPTTRPGAGLPDEAGPHADLPGIGGPADDPRRADTPGDHDADDRPTARPPASRRRDAPRPSRRPRLFDRSATPTPGLDTPADDARRPTGPAQDVAPPADDRRPFDGPAEPSRDPEPPTDRGRPFRRATRPARDAERPTDGGGLFAEPTEPAPDFEPRTDTSRLFGEATESAGDPEPPTEGRHLFGGSAEPAKGTEPPTGNLLGSDRPTGGVRRRHRAPDDASPDPRDPATDDARGRDDAPEGAPGPGRPARSFLRRNRAADDGDGPDRPTGGPGPLDPPTDDTRGLDPPTGQVRGLDRPAERGYGFDQRTHGLQGLDQQARSFRGFEEPARSAQPLDQPTERVRSLDQPTASVRHLDRATEPVRGLDQDGPPVHPPAGDGWHGAGLGEPEVVDAERLRDRVRALGRLADVLGERVDAERREAAHALMRRAGERLALSGRHTVVALAGATGSGKSSLFNAVCGLDLSRVGVRRPTTGEAHACVWDPDGADPLLDWLGVPAIRRMARESALDGQDQAGLRGLVLLDLPDFDSAVEDHRQVVDRLVGTVDQVIWVVDPQKYADQLMHENYLRRIASRAAGSMVVLNQVDRLTPDDAQRMADDLRRLLTADGLASTPLHLTSAQTLAGVPQLRAALAQAVTDRQAALRRLDADVTAVAADLGGVLGPPAAEDSVDRDGVRTLANELAEMAGVPGAADAAARDYRRRGRRATSWLFLRPLGRRRRPGRELEQDRYDTDWADPADAGQQEGGPEHRRPDPSAGRAADRRFGLDRSARALADRVGETLPAPWPEALREAATSRTGELSEALDQAARLSPGTGAGAGEEFRPRWWTGANIAQWLLAAAIVGGVLALVLNLVLGRPGQHALALTLAGVTVVGALVAGLVLGLAFRPAVLAGAHGYRRELDTRLRAAVTEAAREHVVAPVRVELRAYATARSALDTVHSGHSGDGGSSPAVP